MKTYALFLITFLIATFTVLSQNKETIIDTLEASDSGAGSVVVESDPDITALLGTPNKRAAGDDGEYAMTKTNGYRLLAYMGSDQRKARGEASGRQNLIKEKFADIGTYLVYNAPHWKLLVGDFVTREEAAVFRQLFQKEFPELGKEVYIVNDVVNVPVYR